nr:Dihydrofolate reductase [uncultured bacterium]
MSAIVSLVIARAANGVIGQRGQIPWRIPADMKHFKAVTMGKPCIMGRKTWHSLPKKPLPGRTNIVLTREMGFHAEGAVLAHSFDDALVRAEAESPEEIAVIGGADIYRVALPRAVRIYLTDVHGVFEGDVHMPEFNPLEWKQVAREDHAANETGVAFSFVTLERR